MEKSLICFDYIKYHYDKIKYKANDGKWYYLKDYFPEIIPVPDDLYSIFLDTKKNENNQYCDFFQFTMKKLYRNDCKVADIKFLK
jgi:hypothetical protein